MTTHLDLTGIHSDAAQRIRPFFDQLLQSDSGRIHSLNVVGSAVSGDYNPARSDVNSVVILHDMDLVFLEKLAPLGKTHARRRVKAPLIMTPTYIAASLDVFPIEFREMAQIHWTAWGEDILAGLPIDVSDLRHQCEKDLKAKLIGLRQGYLSMMGDGKRLSEEFGRTISGYAPLFRAILTLVGPERPPSGLADVLARLETATGISTRPYRQALEIKQSGNKPGISELNSLFEDYYRTTEELSRLIDEHQG